jgi:hypothetical protein
MDKTAQARAYYEHVDVAYQEWFRQALIQDTGVSEGSFTGDTGLDDIRSRFNRWFDGNKLLLRKKICEEWRYNQNREKFVDVGSVIAAIAALLEGWVAAPLAVAAILVKQYLDQLCNDPSIAT